jgi:hypothetical protein
MNNYFITLLLVLTTLLSSCRKMRYNEATVKGKVINIGTGLGMPNETVNLVEYGPGGFLLPDKATVIATALTDAGGNFGFLGVDLRKNDKYYYKVQFVHHGTTKCCYCDEYRVDKSKSVHIENIPMWYSGSLRLKILPDIESLNVQDEINIYIKNSVDLDLLPCAGDQVHHYTQFVRDTITKSRFSTSTSVASPSTQGNAWYFLEIEKNKGGIVTTYFDTVYVTGITSYEIQW